MWKVSDTITRSGTSNASANVKLTSGERRSAMDRDRGGQIRSSEWIMGFSSAFTSPGRCAAAMRRAASSSRTLSRRQSSGPPGHSASRGM